jgi:cell wall-associated NlpC family hydrolase
MINSVAAKEWFMRYEMSLLNTAYLWGGDDPTGFDCSGMVVEGLKCVGLLDEHEDLTADAMWRRFSKKHETNQPERGCLAFWFDGHKATHVAVCLTNEMCLTANGGGSKTLTLADAIKQNAFVTFRPIKHRKAEVKFLNLFVQP